MAISREDECLALLQTDVKFFNSFILKNMIDCLVSFFGCEDMTKQIEKSDVIGNILDEIYNNLGMIFVNARTSRPIF